MWDIPVASNRTTADFIISSPLIANGYQRAVPDYGSDSTRVTGGKRLKDLRAIP